MVGLADAPVELRKGLYRVAVDNPFPERCTYAYLARQQRTRGVRWQVLDPGYYTAETERTWMQSFGVLGVDTRAVSAIYVTHFHSDHLGAAGWLQKVTGAPVYVLDQEIPFSMAAAQGTPLGQLSCEERERWFAALGTPLDDESVREHVLESWRQGYYPALTMSTLHAGAVVPFGDHQAEVLWAPGHSSGQLAFYVPKTAELFSGDHILPKITPNISRMAMGLQNPLGYYMRSLQELLTFPIERILPAHGIVLNDGVQRIREIYDHHIERAELTLQLAGEDRDVFGICTDLFSYRTLHPRDYRLALGETLAHLEYLAHWGWVDRVVGGHVTLPEARLEHYLLDESVSRPTLHYRPHRERSMMVREPLGFIGRGNMGQPIR